MAEKAEIIESFIDMVDGPSEEPPVDETPTEQIAEELTEDELPAGDEHEVDPTPEGDDKEEVALFEVTVGDNVYEVPEELADIVRQADDYTQKTQEVSAERKTWETLQAQNKVLSDQFEFAQSVQTEVTQVHQLDATIGQYRDYKRQNIDTLTPTDFIKLDTAIEELEIQRQATVDALQTKQTEFQQAQEQSLKELLDKSTEVLRSKIQNWNDELETQTKEFGQSLGFTKAELDTIRDPRYMHVLWMASQFKAIQDNTAPAVNKVKAAPAIQPKARKSMPKETQEALNLRKKIKSQKLSPRDKRKLIEQDIGGRWA